MGSRRTTLAQPTVCKKDEDIAAHVENWEKLLKEYEDEGGKPFEDQERITGILGMLPPGSKIKEHLDLTEERLLTYNDWRREILRWARARRIETKRCALSGSVNEVTTN